VAPVKSTPETPDALAALELLWKPLPTGQTIQDRLGKFDGLVMQSKVDRIYEDVPARGTTLPFFDSAGTVLLERHPINDRVQDAIVEHYAAGILSEGLGQNLRGQPHAMRQPNSNKYWLISNAMLTEAVYLAAARCRSKGDIVNRQLAQTLADGLQNCKMYRTETPDDVVAWIRDRHNSKHYGSKVSLIEFLKSAVIVEAQFLNHAREKGWTARDGDGTTKYPVLFFEYARNRLPQLKSGEMWDATIFGLNRF